MTDYRNMSAGDFALAVGIDARKWAEAAVQLGFCTDEGAAIGWFANAIMAGYDAANGGGPLNGDHAEFLMERERHRGDE